MSDENNKMQIDIENLFKQNVNDLSAIKELYRKLKEVEEKTTQIKYIDNTLVKKIKKEYEKLKKIILDENIQLKLNNSINEINSQLTNDIETINSQMDTMKNNFCKSVKDFGAVGDGKNDDTNSIKMAINYAIQNKCSIYFPNGNYKSKKIEIIGQPLTNGDDLDISIIGESSKTTTIECIDDDCLFSFVGQYTTRRCQLRNVLIKSLRIISKDKNNLAFKFVICQHFTLEDLWIRGFKNGAFYFRDTFDFQYNNIDIFQCARANSADDYAYAITFDTKYDNCNAHKFINSRLEYCELFIKSNGNNRHNFFTNVKFEKGPIDNLSGLSPFYFNNVRELSFNQCFFTYANKTNTTPIDEGVPYIYSLSTTPMLQFIKFTNCNFACSGESRCIWYKGYGTIFDTCDFYGLICNDNKYNAFDIRSYNTFNNCFVKLDDNSKLLKINGINNIIKNLRITLDGTENTLQLFNFEKDSNNNIIEYKIVKGEIPRDFINAPTFGINGNIFLKENIVKDIQNTIRVSTSYVDRVNCDFIEHDSNKLTGMNYMHNGQIVTVYFKQNCTLVNSETLITLTGEDVTFKQGEVCRLLLLNEKLIQV